MHNQKDGIWTWEYATYLNENDTAKYDNSVARIVILYTDWRLNSTNSTDGILSSSVTCLAMKSFTDGSRTLEQSIEAAQKQEGTTSETPKPGESVCSTTKMPWIVSALALFFTL